MEDTNYGKKHKGTSRFIMVAPHAGEIELKSPYKYTIGDDINTGEITENIAEELKASFIINKNYIRQKKKRTKKSGFHPNILEDFNRLSWNGSGYTWDRKKPAMKRFFDDIIKFAKYARSHNKKKRAIIVYIHGMMNNVDKIGIDIGFGLKYDGKVLKGTKGENRHPDAGTNTGVRRATREDMKGLKKVFTAELKKYNLRAGIAEVKGGKKVFTAWSRSNAVQYHAVRHHTGLKDVSFQLEIDRNLRDKSKLKSTSGIIAKALKSIYK